MSKNWHPCKSSLEQELNGLKLGDQLSDGSKAVASRRLAEFDYGEPIVQPIVHSSTYRVKNVQQFLDVYFKGGYMYIRYSNPTCEAAEVTINALEGGAGSVVFSSGMGAVTTALLTFLSSGDHVVACSPLYSGTHHFLVDTLKQYNIDCTLIDGYDIEDYKKALRPNTKVIYGETPSNPELSIVDLEKFGQLGASLRERNVISMIDSTFASPVLQKPIKYGIDLVIHSGTKYLGGHSDICAGVVTARTEELWTKLIVRRRILGPILSPFDASLLSRGLKTLHVRVERQSDSALRIAQYLETHDMVDRVFYPGLKSHPHHEVASRQMKKFGGMICFEVKGGTIPASVFVESVRLIQLAVSLGGTESLVEHTATMSHGPMIFNEQERKAAHITDGQIRFSVGLEDVDDLIEDLRQALEKAKSATV